MLAEIPEGPELDAWLAAREAIVPDLRPGTDKRIYWAGRPGYKTRYSLIYLHGFSATRMEVSPVAERVARAIGANLFMTRLAGHGRDGAAMAEPVVGDWLADFDEAMAIGRILGEQVIVVGTSTGATLAVAGAGRDDAGIAGMVLISPNFRLKASGGWILPLPLSRLVVPMVVGCDRSFVPRSEAHGVGWTASYPSVALVPMARLMRRAKKTAVEGFKFPVLFVYSPDDQVVDTDAIGPVAARWGGATEIMEVGMGTGDDVDAHVIAGEILSPGRTDQVVERMVTWLGGLEKQSGEEDGEAEGGEGD